MFRERWSPREQMKERDVETILQRTREKHPGVQPRIISDNVPQFVAKEFKQFIRVSGMTHVRTSPYYPHSNGQLEQYHRTIKTEDIRPGTPLSVDDARRLVAGFVQQYNAAPIGDQTRHRGYVPRRPRRHDPFPPNTASNAGKAA